MEVAAGPLVLVTITFLVPNEDIAVEDLLIGLPVLQHLGVDTKILPDERRDLLDCADCSFVQVVNEPKHGGVASRLVTAPAQPRTK